jgi:formylglycine-generating enzyme required for sulfatase activity
VPVEFTNSIGIRLRLIPPGKFLMGTSDSDPDHWTNRPQHEVTLTKPFYAGAYEVTVGQFKFFANESGYKTTAEQGAGAFRPLGVPHSMMLVQGTSWQDTGLNQTDDHPVVCVTVDDAKVFCHWLSTKEGRTYALPTEAQWEYCCRAGTPTDFSFGNDAGLLDLYGWYNRNSGNTTRPVGMKQPNGLGLFDMHGNVSEWTADWNRRYSETPAQDPTGPDNGTEHSYRGGSWQNMPLLCRSAWRMLGNGQDAARASTGFRIVLTSTPASAQPDSGAKDKPSSPVIAPFTNADVQRIAALPAAQQVEEVRKELMRRNSGFDGMVENKIEGGVVSEFRIVTDQVTDIAPIRVFNTLRALQCTGTYTNKPNGLLADLAPLEGMDLAGLRRLDLSNTNVGDAGLAHLKDCKALEYLQLNGTNVTDAGLVIFQDCKALAVLSLAGTKVSSAGLTKFKDRKNLTELYLHYTEIGDAGLAHFKGMPLKVLWIHNTGITDLNPLKGMPLEDIRLTPKNITRGLDILRDMKSLKTIGIEWDQSWPAAEFWERYDREEFKE